MRPTCIVQPKRIRRRNLPVDERQVMICAVCGDTARGYNFNVISCDSCKVFFRRAFTRKHTEKNLETWMNECTHGIGNCIITKSTRKLCSPCRMKRCLAVGMKREWITPLSQLAKRSNCHCHKRRRSSSDSLKSESSSMEQDLSETSHFQEDYKRCVDEVEKKEASCVMKLEASTNEFKEEMKEPVISPTNQQSSSRATFESSTSSQKVCEDTELLTSALFDSYMRVVENMYVTLLEPLTDDEVQNYKLNQRRPTLDHFFNTHEFIVRRLIRTFKHIPQFTLLSKDAQVSLVKNSVWAMVNIFLMLHVNVDQSTAMFKYGNETARIDLVFDDLRYTFREGFDCVPTEQYSALLSILEPNQIESSSECVSLVNGDIIRDFLNRLPLSPCLMSIYDDYVSYSTGENNTDVVSECSHSSTITIGGNEQDSLIRTNRGIPEVIEKQINRMIINYRDLNHKIIELVAHDRRLLLIVCLSRLFSVEGKWSNLYLSKTDEYLIKTTQIELQWFLVEFARRLWSNASKSQHSHKLTTMEKKAWFTDLFKCGTLRWQPERVKTELLMPLSHSSPYLHLTLSERLTGLKQIQEYINKAERFLIHMLYHIKMEKMSPLIKEFVTQVSEEA